MKTPLLTLALLTSLTAGATAQQVYGGPDPDRQSSTAMVFGENFTTLAAMSIGYSQPEWQDAYNSQLDKLKGQKLRLGKNWWTSFQTVTNVHIGGVHVAAGSYVAGMHCDKDGKFALLLIEAGAAMRGKMVPFNPTTWSDELSIPLEFNQGGLEKTVKKMEIEIAVAQDQPTNGKFAIRWGKHELSAAVKLKFGGSDMDGSWVGEEVGGGEVSMTIDGNKVRFDGQNGEWYEGMFELDTSKTPHTGTMTIKNCPFPQFNGMKSNLLVKMDGDELVFAGNEPGSKSAPSSFKPGNSTRVFRFKRGL